MSKGVILTLALLLASPVAAEVQQVYPTTAVVRIADPVERWLYCVGIRPEKFYFSFRTVYKVNGEVVEAGDWWRTVKPGMVLEVKATKRATFWFAEAANLRVPKEK